MNMDRNEYETLEYLQTDTVEDNNQFFVLQDDGTFLSINRPVEFVSQVQTVDNVLGKVQPNYDVASQEFYVDVNNSSQLIAVPDEFIIPSENNTIYSNNYLLQQTPSTSEIQINQNVNQLTENVVDHLIIPEITPMDVNLNNNIDSGVVQNNGCTEITITDEQYKILERKGWILLETNDKTYLIDTLGLHDITNNNILIQKLRAELANDNNLQQSYSSNELDMKMLLDQDIQSGLNSVQNPVQFESGSSSQIPLPIDIQTFNPIAEEPSNLQITETKEVSDLMPIEKEFLENTVNELSEKYEICDPRINSNTIKIKTKFSVQDIPEEIVLGRTANGKKLVARIAKNPPVSTESTDTDPNAEKRKPKTYPCINAFHQKIERLIQQAVRGNINVLSEEEVAANADSVIRQLLRVPAFKPAVIERKLIITKIIMTEDKDQTTSVESDPIIITGRVTKQNDQWVFLYIPEMLTNIKEYKAEEIKTRKHGDEDVDMAFLQIHIQEVKSPDGVSRVSMTLNKRVILLKSKPPSEKKLKTDKQTSPKEQPIYACTACAEVFQTIYKLKIHHQQKHKMDFDFDSLLTIGTKTNGTPYNTVPIGPKKEFVCNVCKYKTNRQSIMLRHIKSHFKSTVKKLSEEDTNNSDKISQGFFKCKMCSINFSYASTLSKHILTKHINIS